MRRKTMENSNNNSSSSTMPHTTLAFTECDADGKIAPEKTIIDNHLTSAEKRAVDWIKQAKDAERND